MMEQPPAGQEHALHGAASPPQREAQPPRPGSATDVAPSPTNALVGWSILYLVLICAVWVFFGTGPQ